MSVPIGVILPFYGKFLPAGYLLCNGDPIYRSSNDTFGFNDLYNWLIAANPSLRIDADSCHLPDFQGVFLRGWDVTNVVDPGRALGSYQADAIQDHTHFDRGHSHGTDAAQNHNPVDSDNSTEKALAPNTREATIYTGHADLTGAASLPNTGFKVSVAKETRPKNVAVNYIIKAKKNGEELPLRDILDALDVSHRRLITHDDQGNPVDESLIS